MSAGPGVTPANFAKFFLIFASTALSTLIWSCFDGRPLAPAGAAAAAAVVRVRGRGAPGTGARTGGEGGTGGRVGGPAAPAWADGSKNAAVSAAAVIGRIRLNGALRMCLLLRASLGRRPVAAGA